MKWSMRFHAILMANNKAAASFWYDSPKKSKKSIITLKLNSLNANLLVSCVYMADGNNLHASALKNSSHGEVPEKSRKSRFNSKQKKRAETVVMPETVKVNDDDDDLTQITSSSLTMTPTKEEVSVISAKKHESRLG